tara:strand:- start:1880 stop:3478 length:1599 start_codon:yes stop_codon:yes gene_type:complete
MNLETRLTLTTEKGSKTFSYTKEASQEFDYEQIVDSNDAFITMVEFNPASKAQTTLENPRVICLYNSDVQPVEVRVTYQGITAGASDGASGADGVISKLLRGGEFLVYPNATAVNYITADESAMNGTDIAYDDQVLVSARYADSGATLGANLEDSDTTVTVSDLSYFKVGDLIQVGIDTATATRLEIMQVTAVASGGASGALTVRRALYGTSKADKDTQDNGTSGAVSGAKVYFPFFNMFEDVFQADGTTLSTELCTNHSGNYKTSNFFGYGRNSVGVLDGFCKGTIAFKFYKAGYQEFGLSGITATTSTGLTAGNTYYLKIAIDGAGTPDEISITPVSSNTAFGGTNGFIQLLQEAIDALYNTSTANNFERGATVALVDGDIRVTSNQHLSTSAIALTAGASGSDASDRLFAQQNGRIQTAPEGAVPARLPDTYFYKDGVKHFNIDEIMFDDGYGNLQAGSAITGEGTINYDTGAVTLKNCPKKADFVISAIGKSGLGCGADSSTTMLTKIQARSTNAKRNGRIRIVTYDI